jgi:hypothetical protein
MMYTWLSALCCHGTAEFINCKTLRGFLLITLTFKWKLMIGWLLLAI